MADLMYAAVKALVELDGKILVLKADLGESHIWIPPGGRLEYGEAPLEALKREVKGETSLEIEPGEPVGMYHFFHGPDDGGEQVTLTVFEVESFEGDVDMETEHAEEDSLTDYQWVAPRELLDMEATESFKELVRENYL